MTNLAGQAPLLPGADVLAYPHVDDTLSQTYGYARQGAGRGYPRVNGLDALLAVVSAPVSRPPAAQGRGEIRPECEVVRQRCAGHDQASRRKRAAGAADRLA